MAVEEAATLPEAPAGLHLAIPDSATDIKNLSLTISLMAKILLQGQESVKCIIETEKAWTFFS